MKHIAAIFAVILGILSPFSAITALAGEIEGQWQPEAAIPLNSYFCNGGIAWGDEIFLIPGDRNTANYNVEIYNVKTKEWRTGAEIPVKGINMGIALYGDKIYVMGGLFGPEYALDNSLDNVQIYDIPSNTWTAGAPMPTKRYSAVCTALDGKIYAFGGAENSQLQRNNRFDIYDIASDTWAEGETPLHNVAVPGTAVIGKEIYVIGGLSETKAIDNVQIYDTVNKEWREGSPSPNKGAVMAAVNGNKIYVMGGCSDMVSPALTDTNIYSPSEDSWTAGPALLQGRAAGWAAVANDTVYVGGGTAAANIVPNLNTIESLSLIPNRVLSISLNISEQVQLSVSYDLSDNTGLSWSSSDEGIATVGTDGKVTAVGEGLAYISARNADGTFNESVAVRVFSGGADAYRLAAHLNTGGKAKLYLTEDASQVTWSSMDETVATVTADGQVTGVAKGLAIVQGALEGETYQIYVRVNA